MKINIFIVGSFISLIAYALINSLLGNRVVSGIIAIVIFLVIFFMFKKLRNKD